MSEPRIITVFHADVNNNDDILEAIRLKKTGFKFHIDRIDFEETDRMALSESDRKEWDDISLEAWNNCGYINGKPDGWEDTKQNAQNVEESAMPYTKAPWKAVGVDDSYEIFDVAETYDIAWAIDSEANAKRIVACVNACKGITNEALEKGILDDAIALVLNAGKDIGVTWDGMAPYYEGVKVWEEAK